MREVDFAGESVWVETHLCESGCLLGNPVSQDGDAWEILEQPLTLLILVNEDQEQRGASFCSECSSLPRARLLR